MPSPSATPKLAFFATKGWRFAMMIALTLAMFVPLILISFIVEDRVTYQRQAVNSASSQWGGPITVDGPMIVIPVEHTGSRTIRDDDGTTRTEPYRERRQPIVLRPEVLDITADVRSEVRHRGIFEIPVFASDQQWRFNFDISRVAGALNEDETILWDRAALFIYLPATRSVTGQTELKAGERVLELEPGLPHSSRTGIHAMLGDPRGLSEFSLSLGLNGTQQFEFEAAGRQTNVSIVSDWPHPSFSGSFLPVERTVTDEGFTARWEIPHLARNVRQVERGEAWTGAQFGVRFYNPVDIYQRTQRAVKYGILFIALTFLTVFLMERMGTRPVHAAQFVLIGVAQCIFFLLLLSFAEQIGFTASYIAAGAATIGLITVYAVRGLGLGGKAPVLGGALVAIYGVIFLILRSADYALLAGSVLAFISVALVMLMTQRESWGRAQSLRQPL
jgi:inner membrane protein